MRAYSFENTLNNVSTWEVRTRAEIQQDFVVESKRWVVERTFAWIGKYRRLGKNYEFYENAAESFISLDFSAKC